MSVRLLLFQDFRHFMLEVCFLEKLLSRSLSAPTYTHTHTDPSHSLMWNTHCFNTVRSVAATIMQMHEATLVK